MKMSLRKLGLLLVLVALGVSCSKDDDDDDNAVLNLKGSMQSGSAKLNLDGETSGSPTSFKVTFYKTYLSTNADCSSLKLVDDYGSDGKEIELADGTSIITNAVAPGTYKCVALVMSDNLIFKADQEAVDDHAGCKSTSKTHTFDVYREGGEDEAYIDIDGKEITATGSRTSASLDKITIFASTGSASAIKMDGKAIAANQYAKLEDSLTSPGTAYYYWDATDGIKNTSEDGKDYCVIEEVSTGFRNE